MIDPRQESELTSLGDCQLHWHSSDRARSHTDVLALQAATPFLTVTANYTVTDAYDYVLVDTTSGNLTVTLPPAKGAREVEIAKKVAANTLVIIPSGSDTVVGDTSVVVTERWTSLRFKAYVGGWALI